jgi:membrane protein implicated in regulation of membrane protease activity
MKKWLIAIGLAILSLVIGFVLCVAELLVEHFYGTWAGELVRLVPWAIIATLVFKLLLDIKSCVRINVHKKK